MGCGAQPEICRRGGRLRRRWRDVGRQLRGRGGVSAVIPVDLVIRGWPPTLRQLLQELLSMSSAR
jgi:hypothetical protein